jgi:hypothetical protein
MKKFILAFFVSLTILFIFSNIALGAPVPCTQDESNGGENGLVPCGIAKNADGSPVCPCNLGHFFVMFANIYGFIIKYIATTLAVIMITVGAIFMLISAGNPNLAGTGKKMIYSAIIGLVLVYGSYLIIDALLKIMGYTGNWFSLP